MTTITLPDLAEGEIYAGLLLNEDGSPSHHLILLPSRNNKKLPLEKAMKAAEQAGGDLPTRRELSLLFANCKQHFDRTWYWSSEIHESESGWAWCQDFGLGYQGSTNRNYELRARAVRRLPI